MLAFVPVSSRRPAPALGCESASALESAALASWRTLHPASQLEELQTSSIAAEPLADFPPSPEWVPVLVLEPVSPQRPSRPIDLVSRLEPELKSAPDLELESNPAAVDLQSPRSSPEIESASARRWLR